MGNAVHYFIFSERSCRRDCFCAKNSYTIDGVNSMVFQSLAVLIDILLTVAIIVLVVYILNVIERCRNEPD